MPPEDIYRTRSPSLTSEQLVTKGKPARESKILRQRSASIETEAKPAPPPPPPVAKEVPKPEPPPKLETAFIPSAYDEPVGRKSRPLRESTAIAKKRNVSSTRSSRSSSTARDAESVPDSLEAARRARLRSASKSPSTLQRTPTAQAAPPPPVEPPKPPTPTPAKEPPPKTPEPRSRSQSQTRELETPQDDSLKYTLSYLTDVALFGFACWLYLFKNPKWAIPVIALIMYRQIKDAMRDRMPPWVRRSLGTDS